MGISVRVYRDDACPRLEADVLGQRQYALGLLEHGRKLL
jgi:hypothetical protein